MSRFSYCQTLVGNNSQMNEQSIDSFGPNPNAFGISLPNLVGNFGNGVNSGLHPTLNPGVNNNINNNLNPNLAPNLNPKLGMNMNTGPVPSGSSSNGGSVALKSQISSNSANSPTLSPNTPGSRGSYVPSQKDTTFTKIFVGGLPYHTTGI